MKEQKKKDLQAVKEGWRLCLNCAACYYRGPIVPHNWRELPPPEWSSPLKKCPSFEYFKFKSYTALGRGNLAALVFRDPDFTVADDLIEILYTCNSCGMCDEVCQMYKPLRAILALREELVRRGVRLPNPLETMEANIKARGNIFGARKLPGRLKAAGGSGENLYYAGCNARFKHPEVASATLEVLKTAGMETGFLGERELCCGFVPGHDGNTLLLEEQAEKNVSMLKETGARRVIVSCAHCYKALKKDYPLIVGPLPFDVVHVAEIFSDLLDRKRIVFKKELNRKVTYHDPCFLGRQFRVFDAPRKVLESIPGIELAEMERNRRWSYCCGSGAKITAACYPEYAAFNTRERLLEASEAAGTMVTACTTCFAHLDGAIKKEGIVEKLYDLPLLVAEALGIPV